MDRIRVRGSLVGSSIFVRASMHGLRGAWAHLRHAQGMSAKRKSRCTGFIPYTGRRQFDGAAEVWFDSQLLRIELLFGVMRPMPRPNLAEFCRDAVTVPCKNEAPLFQIAKDSWQVTEVGTSIGVPVTARLRTS